MDDLRDVVPEPLKGADPLVRYAFIRMPGSADFGVDTEFGQVIPVTIQDIKGSSNHSMLLNNNAPNPPIGCNFKNSHSG